VLPEARATLMSVGRLFGGVELSVALTLPLPAIVTVLVMPLTPVPVTAEPEVDKPVPCGNGSCTVDPGGPAHAATPIARTAVNTAKRLKNTAKPPHQKKANPGTDSRPRGPFAQRALNIYRSEALFGQS
jgi:hypothetical protein